MNFYRSEGRYNLLGDERQAQYVVHMPNWAPFRAVAATCDIDSEWDCHDSSSDTWEVLEHVFALRNRLWFTTSREQYAEQEKWCRDNEPKLRLHFLRNELAAADLAKAAAYKRADSLRNRYMEQLWEMEDAQQQVAA